MRAAIGGGGARRARGIVRLPQRWSGCESGGGGAGLQRESRGRDHGECGVVRGVGARQPRAASPPTEPGVGGVARPSGSARWGRTPPGGPRRAREAEAGAGSAAHGGGPAAAEQVVSLRPWVT